MIDSGFQMNLEKENAIPSFYWEKTNEHGVAIEGTHVQLKGRVPDFSISISGIKEVQHLNKLDDLKEDCIIGSPFLHKVNPIIVNEPNMIFTCRINGRRVSTSLYYFSSFKCKNLVPQSNPTLSLVELFKMERCIAYAEMHKESALFEISSKLEKDCTSESPNAYWTREKYFVSLTFNPLEKTKSQKSYVALMSPSKREFHANEIK